MLHEDHILLALCISFMTLHCYQRDLLLLCCFYPLDGWDALQFYHISLLFPCFSLHLHLLANMDEMLPGLRVL